jgi:hypothetical protein
MRAVDTVCRFRGGPRSVALLSLTLASGCGGAHSSPADAADAADATKDKQTDQSPEGVDAQFARESEPAEKHLVKTDGGFTASIEAKAPPTIKREGQVLSVSVDLGWDAEVRCYVYSQPIDAGGASNALLKAAGKAVKFKALGPYFLDHQALDPVLGIRGVYHIERDGKLLAGDLKLMAMPRSEHPVICMHDAPGYAKSFQRVSTEFAKSFQFESDEPPPKRGELWTLTLEGTPLGFSREMTYLLDDGKVQRVSLSASFLPTAPGEMSFEDEAEIVTSDKEGTLVSGKYLSLVNGQPNREIDVSRTKTGYNYAGTIENKPVTGSFKSEQAIKSQYATERKFKALARDAKKAKFAQWEYEPSIDTAGASKVSYEVTPIDNGMTIVSTLGQRSVTLKANAHGVVRQAAIASGSRSIQVDLVEEVGEL